MIKKEKFYIATVIIVLLVGLVFADNKDKQLITLAEQRNEGLFFVGELHLLNIIQVTFDGKNAEVYFSSDENNLVFSSNRKQEKPHDTNIFICGWADRI